jgi:hypothetical protein
VSASGEWLPISDDPNDPNLPPHLRADAPQQQCDRCQRWTVASSEFGQLDTMTQPDGRPCGGRFRWRHVLDS